MDLSGKFPAEVVSYDPVRREAKITIEKLTDGSQDYPIAEFCNPFGDKSEHTEIRVLAGDRVWVEFLREDARYPIIVGYRPKQTGNAMDVRRFHHQNIELDADTNILVKAGVNVTLQVGTTIVKVESGTVTIKAANIKLDGATEIIGSISHNGKNIGSPHTHGGIVPGGGSTAPVN
jgi:hypothetical protein